MSRKISAPKPSKQRVSKRADLTTPPEVCENSVMTIESASDVNEMKVLSSDSINVNVSNIPNKKERNKMSKQESATAPATKEIKKTVKYFDLGTFTEGKKEITVNFTPAVKYEDAVQRLGNDEAALVAAINNILEARAIAIEKKAQLGDKAVGKKTVLEFIKPFRMSPPYSNLVTLEKGQDGWKDQYNKQTAELVKQVASNEFMLNAIRAAAAASTDDDESDETDNA